MNWHRTYTPDSIFNSTKMLSLVVILAIFGTLTADPIRIGSVQNESSLGITKGDVAVIEDHPYEVIIEHDNGIICAGSIVSDHYVVTAGFCTYFMNNLTVIRAGSTYKGRDGSVHRVEQIIQSEELPDRHLISLIRVLEPFQFDRTRKAIPLFNQYEEIPIGSKGIVSGWGNTEPNPVNDNDQLYKLEMTILDDEICEISYGIYDNKRTMCAMNDEQKSKDLCSQDGADPLVIDGRLAGLAVDDKNGCTGTTPIVYTKIAYYRDWIDQNMH